MGGRYAPANTLPRYTQEVFARAAGIDGCVEEDKKDGDGLSHLAVLLRGNDVH